MEIIKKYIANNKKTVICFSMLLLGFSFLAVFVFTGKFYYIDSLVHSYILSVRSDNLTSILNIITELGGTSFLLGVSIFSLIAMKKKKITVYVLINLISAFIINETAKALFMRDRPFGINLIDETGFSFPSGHSMVSLAFYGFVVYLMFNKTGNRMIRFILVTLLISLVLLIGFSRIYLGVHYLSDVIAGFLLALMYLIVFINIVRIEKK